MYTKWNTTRRTHLESAHPASVGGTEPESHRVGELGLHHLQTASVIVLERDLYSLLIGVILVGSNKHNAWIHSAVVEYRVSGVQGNTGKWTE